MFLEAVLWIGRTGAPWRDLPPELGHWHTTFTRFARWTQSGIWDRVFQTVSADPDLEEVMIDSTAIRAHSHAAGAQKNAAHKLWGVLAADSAPRSTALSMHSGNPIGFTLTGAEQADISQAPALLDQAPSAGAVIADKGYDANAWVERLESQQIEAVIPPRSNRKSPRDYDRHRYKARNLVERFFNPLKQFRRIATRYEKPAAHFTATVICGCIM